MLQRVQAHAGPDVMCNCTKSLDQISDVKGMAFAWCDATVSTKPASDGLAFDVLGDSTTTIGDRVYTLQTVRLLMPSMHSFWCSPSPLEVQFIHDAECGDRLVLAALFREGEPVPDVHEAIGSLLLGRSQIRLIDLLPLGRRFFIHDASDSSPRINGRELHMICETEMVIAFEPLAELYARMTRHRREVQL